jgi:hypothetical protein
MLLSKTKKVQGGVCIRAVGADLISRMPQEGAAGDGAIQGCRARAVRQDWHGGLERSGARQGRVGRVAIASLCD